MHRFHRWLLGVLIASVCAGVAAKSAISYLPGKMLLEMESSPREIITIRIPLSPIDAAIQESIRESSKSDPSIEYTLISSGFKEFGDGKVTIAYSAHLRGTIKTINQGFDCEVLLRFAIPHTLIPGVMLQDLNSETNCTSNAFLNMMPLVSSILTNSIRGGLTRSLVNNSDPQNIFIQLKNKDPDLYDFLSHGHIQAAYCYFKTIEGLCLRTGWMPYSSSDIGSYMSQLIWSAPKPSDPIGNFDFDTEISRFRAISYREPKDVTYSFPAKYLKSQNPPIYDSGDMALFGGLLCMAGESEGCELVRRSQSSDGRFWRSPTHIGQSEEEDGTFTGDQINGVFAYFATQNDPAAFSLYLDFIRKHIQPVPSPATPIDMAYKSCSNDPKLKCMLAGSEWLFLRAIAKRYGLEGDLPADVRDPAVKFGDTFDDLIWPAAFAPRGYTLHLIGVKIAVARLLGHRTKSLADAAAIIAAREPENPFFLYLHLGPDQTILTKLSRKCYVDPNRKDYFQWQWERAENSLDQSGRTPWETSMGWECVFMYSLLKNHVPVGP